MPTEVLDDPLVGRLFGLASGATEERPLPRLLRDLCALAAEVLPADVVSVYLREDDDEGDVLVMRANVGFPELAIGNVCLAIGEGITGLAAQRARPLLRDRAPSDVDFRSFDGLGEEEFPLFLAWPLLRNTEPIGVVVFQRRADQYFARNEIALAGALCSCFMLALSESERRHTIAEVTRNSEVGHEARLGGSPVSPGVALGQAQPLPTIAQLVGDTEEAGLLDGLDRAKKQIDRDINRLKLPASLDHELRQLRLVLEDARFSDQLLEEVTRRGLAPGLASLSRRYALTAAKTIDDGWLAKRATEVSALCRVLAGHLAGKPLTRQGSVVILAERPGSLIAVDAVVRRASAVTIADTMDPDSLAARILRMGGIPTVADVAGLFDWARPGDPIAVNADEGTVWVNPSQGRVAKTKSYMPGA